MVKKGWKLGAAVLAAVFAVEANAATVQQLIGSGGRIFVSDESGEQLINRVGSTDVIDVGDSIRGVLTFDQFKKDNGPLTPLLHQVGNSEFGGVFQVLVTAKIATGDPTAPWRFTFAPDPAFVAEFGVAAGTMVILYDDPGVSHFLIHSAGSTAASEASVTDGNLFFTLGIANAGNAFLGFGGDTLSTAGNPSTRLGNSIFALSRTSSAGVGGGLDLINLTNPVGTGEFIGTSQIGGPFAGSPWALSNETDAEFQVIPTPSALLGGLLLMGGLLRRKSHA